MVTYMMSFTIPRGRRRATLALALLVCPSFCPPTGAAPAPKKGEKKSAPPPNLGVVGQGMTMTLPDPKFPGTGKLLYYLHAAGADGHTDPDGSFHGSITKIWARLYQKGVPSAVLTAPLAQGGGAAKAIVITGKGGVVVKSLTQPGTILTADTVVWHVSSGQIVAMGHVVYHNGKSGMTTTGPLMNADTKLRAVAYPTGFHATMPF